MRTIEELHVLGFLTEHDLEHRVFSCIERHVPEAHGAPAAWQVDADGQTIGTLLFTRVGVDELSRAVAAHGDGQTLDAEWATYDEAIELDVLRQVAVGRYDVLDGDAGVVGWHLDLNDVLGIGGESYVAVRTILIIELPLELAHGDSLTADEGDDVGLVGLDDLSLAKIDADLGILVGELIDVLRDAALHFGERGERTGGPTTALPGGDPLGAVVLDEDEAVECEGGGILIAIVHEGKGYDLGVFAKLLQVDGALIGLGAFLKMDVLVLVSAGLGLVADGNLQPAGCNGLGKFELEALDVGGVETFGHRNFAILARKVYGSWKLRNLLVGDGNGLG